MKVIPECPEDLFGNTPLTPRELDSALRVCPELKQTEWSDGLAYSDGYCYYVQHFSESLPNLRIGSKVRSGNIWVRVGVDSTPASRHEPETHDLIFLDDKGEYYPSLVDAVIESKVEILRSQLRQEADNTCYNCFGCGFDNPLAEEGEKCLTCSGKGFIEKK